MSEQKVWVEEMPESCDECKYYTQFTDGMGCIVAQELRPMDECGNYMQASCPLRSIKDHDQELVKEVCEKISTELENETETYCEIRQCSSPHYQGDYVWFNYVKFGIFIAQILKEFEK